jgi:hypothetical protein
MMDFLNQRNEHPFKQLDVMLITILVYLIYMKALVRVVPLLYPPNVLFEGITAYGYGSLKSRTE